MPATLVSTMGTPKPYITVQELKRNPVYNQLKNLVPNSSDADRDAELARLIMRASSMANGETNQNLVASVDTEIGQVVVSDWGDLRIHTRSTPITSVQAISVGPDPVNLVPLSATTLSTLVLDPWRITVPRTYTNSALNLPSVSWTPGSRMWAQWTYVSGWPITTLTAASAIGATSLTVEDTTGIVANQTLLTVQDGKWLEQFIPTAVTGNTLTVPAMAYAHTVGTGVTNLPDDIKEAIFLLLGRIHDTWSLTMNVISTDGTGSKKPAPGPARKLCDAGEMLRPYRRTW